MKTKLAVLVGLLIVAAIGVYLFVPIKQKQYFENGSLKSEFLLKGGKKNGLYKEFYENGAVKLETNFSDGLQNGSLTSYYPNGALKRRAFFNRGIQVDSLIDYYEDGRVLEKGLLFDGERTGLFRSFHKNGRLWKEGSYRQGLKQGLWNSYNEKGIITKTVYRNDSIISNFDGVQFENYLLGSLLYLPNGWQLVKQGDNFHAFASNIANTGVSIVETGQVLRASSIEDVLKNGIAEIRSVSKNFVILLERADNVAQTALVKFKAERDGQTYMCSLYMVKVSGYVIHYNCMYASPNKIRTIETEFLRIIESLKINERLVFKSLTTS